MSGLLSRIPLSPAPSAVDTTHRFITVASKDRSKGEEIAIAGAALMIRRDAWSPGALAIAFDNAGAPRIPVRADMVIYRPFQSVWLFHSTGDTYAGELELLALATLDQGVEPVELRPHVAHRKDMRGISASGNTQVIAAPGVGLRIRVVRFRYELTLNATLAAAGVQSVQLQTSGPGLLEGTRHLYYLPSATPSGAFGSLDTGWVEVGGAGLLCRENTALNVQLGAALATGEAQVCVGYELVPVPGQGR